MRAYRDRSYCASDCQIKKCPHDRQLTYSIVRAAEKAGMGISQSDFSSDCEDYVPKESQDNE